MIYLGVDPGLKGAGVMITASGNVLVQPWTTTKDVCDWLETFIDGSTYAVVEKVTRPTKLTRNAGEWIGMLTALKIPFVEVSPVKWQKHFGTFAKERTRRKNQLKQIAQQLHPQIKWTHVTADAYLLAVYGRQQWK